jgi:hypothetical protein
MITNSLRCASTSKFVVDKYFEEDAITPTTWCVRRHVRDAAFQAEFVGGRARIEKLKVLKTFLNKRDLNFEII